MSKFLVLYQSEAALTGFSVTEMFANTTPEQMAAGMGAWQAWLGKHGAAITDPGAPLDHSTTVADGVATAGKSIITGYSFIEAASMEDAVEIVKEHPHFHTPGSPSVQILQCIAMPGM